jgi:hypothetical protein
VLGESLDERGAGGDRINAKSSGDTRRQGAGEPLLLDPLMDPHSFAQLGLPL